MSVASATLAALAFTAPSPSSAAPPPSGGERSAAEQSVPAAAKRVVVRYKSSAAAVRSDEAARADAKSKARATRQTLRYESRLGTHWVVYSLGSRRSRAEVAAVMAEFRTDRDVVSVQPERRLRPLAPARGEPDDPEYGKQWDLFADGAGMNVPDAWNKSTGEGVNVAVVDTGYTEHSDLDANVAGGYDFIADGEEARDGDGYDDDPSDEGDWAAAGECGEGEEAADSSWHGTHVAGTIAALTGNGRGVAGLAPKARITPVRVLGRCGGGTVDIYNAIVWASGGKVDTAPDGEAVPVTPDPAEVINLSLGGPSFGCDPLLQEAIDEATSRGSTVVVSAGNSNQDAYNSTPANCARVVTVAASDRGGDRAYYSNFGDRVDVTAPGGETRAIGDPSDTTPEDGILSTMNDSRTEPGGETYKAYMGTSMAAPHIAGLAALMKSVNTGLTPADIEEAVKANARELPGTCEGGCGAGLADAAKTVASVTTDTQTVR